MALVRKIILPGFANIGVWKIEETEDELMGRLVLDRDEEARLKLVRHPRKRLEWLASRLLLKRILNTRQYLSMYKDSHGKPHLVMPIYHSISHSGDYATVIVSPWYKVGIDIETPRRSIKALSHKFISVNEREEMEEPNNVNDIILFWGGKEVIYKIYGLKQLDFRKHMKIGMFESGKQSGRMDGELRKNSYHSRYLLNYCRFENYMLVYGYETANPSV